MIEQRTSDLRDHTDRLMESDNEKTILLAKLREQSEAFERQAREDALTGLANRRSMDEARRCCERLRLVVEQLDCTSFAPGWKLTISGGLAERTGLSHYEKLLSRADALLYEAKHAGRNCVHG